MPLYPPPSSGSAAGIVRYGSGVPSAGLGANDDWYLRSDTPNGLYRKVAGAWVLYDASLYSALRDYTWTNWSVFPGGLTDNLVTVADTFWTQQTGVTLSGGIFTASAANAYGLRRGFSGAFLSFDVTTLPGAGQTLEIAWGTRLSGNHLPSIVINNAGTAVVSLNGSTIRTFATTVVAGGAGSRFAIRQMSGAVLMAQQDAATPQTIRDQVLVPNLYLANQYINGFFQGGPMVKGHGAFQITVHEVSL